MIVEDAGRPHDAGPRRADLAPDRRVVQLHSPVDFEQTGNVDYSPRASGVHVLLKLDESTYGEEDGNTR